MNIKTLRRLRHVDDLDKFSKILQSISSKNKVSIESLLTISNSDINDLRYLNSVIGKGGLVVSHLLVYKDSDTGFHGLARVNNSSDEVFIVTEPIYSSFNIVSSSVIVAYKSEGTYDIYNNDVCIARNILEVDFLNLGDLVFIQLDLTGGKSLLCLDVTNIKNEYYFPSSRKDFDSWVKPKIKQQMYEGYLDDYKPSAILAIYYEVINCIFINSYFIPYKSFNNSED